jgi:hypothetical protein
MELEKKNGGAGSGSASRNARKARRRQLAN